jgi:hypothetical protein
VTVWCIVCCSGSNRSSVRFGLATKKTTAQAAADAVAAADAAAEAEELELAVKVGIHECTASIESCSFAGRAVDSSGSGICVGPDILQA